MAPVAKIGQISLLLSGNSKELKEKEPGTHCESILFVMLCKEFMHRVVTGYLPSVILILFLYAVPPTMMLFSAMEGNISRSQRKRSACIKVLYNMGIPYFTLKLES
uniref:CSC1/OSCA1-like 7TM region domain-containing protein n=2 Tax=Gossypium raimondii TaxID=29730 RepID=A0A0D2U2Z2_GOSRA|nr:hypothetical protein B456_010G051200 [Gossypium raimondii]